MFRRLFSGKSGRTKTSQFVNEQRLTVDGLPRDQIYARDTDSALTNLGLHLNIKELIFGRGRFGFYNINLQGPISDAFIAGKRAFYLTRHYYETFDPKNTQFPACHAAIIHAILATRMLLLLANLYLSYRRLAKLK